MLNWFRHSTNGLCQPCRHGDSRPKLERTRTRRGMTRLRVGVVGVGHLGKEHARILSGMPDITLVGVADPNMNQAEAVALRCGTQAFSEHRPLLDCVDAAVIA